jgi:hypothetical protein
MPLKRVTPSFTVEYRQAKRPNTGRVKPGWAHAKPPPAGVDETANRIAISAFKTVAAHPPADAISPSIPPGRILPSLVEAGPVTGRADAGGAQSRNYGGAAQAGYAMQAPADGAVARELGEHIYSDESREPSVATIFRSKQPATSDPSPPKAAAPRSEKRTQRPAEKHPKFNHASSAPAEMSETAPVNSTSGLPPVDKPSSTSRTSRILDRYVFRDERGPGDSWKRRIEARRERRVNTVLVPSRRLVPNDG